jgi:manganese/zinc/iron transport system permease protein
MPEFLQLDFPALFGGSLAALACALVGNYLVLTRRAMFTDAISHVTLPGVLIAFLITGSTATLPMLIGGVGAALIAAGLVFLLTRLGGVEPSAALGVVFTSLFASGVVLMEQSGAARTTFDVHHVLYGNLEGLVWPAATGFESLGDPGALSMLPDAIGRMAVILALVAAMVAIWHKELALAAFDPAFAAASGVPVRLIDLVLLGATALATVAAFESVGVILALAMIVCPAASARLLTRRLGPQIALSLMLALGTVWLGYAIAVLGPAAFGYDLSLNAAGVIGALSGAGFGATAMFQGTRIGRFLQSGRGDAEAVRS